MNDNTSTMPTETEFQDAFSKEMGVEPVVAPVEPVTPPTPPVEEPKTPPAEEPKVEEPKTPPVEEPKTPPAENTEEKATTEAEKAAEAAAEEAPKFATKDDVKEAMREYNQETTSRVDNVVSTKKAVIEKLYPEGIDNNIYDTNGQVIKTAQDIVDRGLINQRTAEPFTYDEAASFMLEAGKKLDENIQEIEKYAEGIAEQNVNIMEGNKRVMAKWGETLKSLPKETVQKIADTYITKQLKFDPKNEYVVEAAMTPEEFYDFVMPAYKDLTVAVTTQKQLEEAQQTEEQKREQAERNGLPPPRGTSETKSNTGDKMVDALIDELAKG